MSRVVLLLFAVMQTQVMVSLAIAPTSICPERCANDDANGQCPPLCVSCPVSTHTVAPTPVRVVSMPAVRPERLPDPGTQRLSEPEPRDIFHVPKLLLA